MQVTTERLNGNPVTVIRRPFDIAKFTSRLYHTGEAIFVEIRGLPGRAIYVSCMPGNEVSLYYMDDLVYVHEGDILNEILILPPLPRNPLPEDVPLLYRYAAEAIHVVFDGILSFPAFDTWNVGHGPRITHAIHDGEQVDVAFGEGE